MRELDNTPQEPPSAEMPARHRYARRLMLVVVLSLLVAGIAWPLLGDGTLFSIDLTPEAFVERIRGWGAWGVAGSLGLMVLHSFVPFPAECLAIANGMVFGLVMGTLITWSGAMAGALLAFWLARRLGRDFVVRRLRPASVHRLETWSREQGWSTLLAVRLVPVIAFNLINYAAGLTPVSWWTFTWTTALGILPLTVLMVFLGEQMTALPPSVWGALLLVALFSWWWLRWLQQRLSRRRPQ